MQEVVCFNCGRLVHISPDAELCSVCGERLRELLHPVHASKYFYDRAAKLAAGDQVLPALQEIDRGLTYQASSELRLLGAILSKRIGDFEQMRHHVAGIPVDDILRPEGEWLLRSHQTRQRELREANKMTGGERSGAFFTDERDLPYAMQPASSAAINASSKVAGPRLGYGLALACLLLVAIGGSALVARNPVWLTSLFWSGGSTELPADSANALDPAVNPAINPVVLPVQDQTAAPGAPTQTLDPTVTPTSDVPANIVQVIIATATPAAVAASTPTLNDNQPFDLASYLQQLGRNDLAQIDASASLQGAVLTLEGIVPSFEARQGLVELAQSAPGATSVNAIGLIVRLPATYTVQAGDTLWDITYRLYGDMTKMQAVVEANQDILPSPEALSVGMTLKLPPFE
jgi:LysM repeat protein